VFVLLDVLGRANENEAGVLTSTTWWKVFSINACHFVRLGMFRIVDDLINSGTWHFIAWFEGIAWRSHNRSFWRRSVACD
jgi:hypothetical protein